MKVEIFGRRPQTTCWHVLVDENTVGHIQRYIGSNRWAPNGWAFKWGHDTCGRYTHAQQAEILAAAEEKTLILNVTARLLR